MMNSSTTPQLPRLSASQVDFGKLKGNGSFCNVVEVTSIPSMKSINHLSFTQNTIANNTSSNVNARWDINPPQPRANNLLQTISHDMDNVFDTDRNNSNFGSKLSLRMSDGTNKLRNLILNTSKYHNRFLPRQQILVAKIPKKNEDLFAYEESVRNLKLEAKILASMNHDNIIRIHAMSEDIENSISTTESNPELPRFFIILDCLSCTLDQKIAKWSNPTIQSRRSSTNDIGVRDGKQCRRSTIDVLKNNDSASSAPGESVYKMLLNRPTKRAMVDSLAGGSTTERLYILLDISSALRYIHKSNVLHRDIKPENVGFDANGTVKIFDFGLAVELNALTPLSCGAYKIHGGIGTCRYMAPEVAQHLPYNHKADVYSFAMLMYNLLSLTRPYEGLQRNDWYQLAILEGRRPTTSLLPDDGISLEIKNLMKMCWNPKWTNRPSFDVIESVLRKDSCRW